MGNLKTVAAQAVLLGGVAAWLTSAYTSPLSPEWAAKDYLFVLAVVAVVLVSGLRSAKFERLAAQERAKKLLQVHSLARVEFVHGNGVQLELNKVTCILFFGSWCEKSRAALQVFARLQEAVAPGGTAAGISLEDASLGKESREELAMYEVKGRKASNFRELKEFPFSIGIEDGFMSKEYLVRCDLFKVPQLFVVGKNKNIVWYGDPSIQGVEATIQAAMDEEDVEVNRIKDEELEKQPQIADIGERMQSIAA